MRRILATVAFAVLLPMCTSSGSDQGAPLTITPGAGTVVGAQGGTVSSASGARLVVPEGALDHDVSIEITVPAEATAPSGYAARSPIYVFSPDGLVFKKPVTVELPLPAIAQADDRIVWSSKLRGVEILASSIAGPTITAQVTHFSEGFVGQPLGAGSEQHGGAEDGGGPTACEDGTWDSDHDPSTPCVPWTTCPPGTHVTNTPSATSDRICAGCSSGTFSTTSNATSCTPWTTCAPGTFVSTPGTASSDRQCSPCPAGTNTSSPNQSSCVPNGSCPAGTVQIASGAPPTCAPCTAGSYCAGGTAPSEPCAGGTWDDDANPATACIAWSSCVAGQHVATEGTATTDRSCVSCTSGTFSTTTNASTCSPWSTCAPGTYVSAPGSTTSDRQCATCPAGTTTTSANQSSCVPTGGCPAGTEQTAPAVCTPCAAGGHCPGGEAPRQPCAPGTWDHDANAATACVAWTDCAPGTRVTSSGSATTDRTCTACASGTFSTTSNATSCTPWTDCQPGTFVSSAGTTVADRQCTACAPGTYSATINQSSCLPADACPAGTEQIAPGTATAPPQCEACPAGHYCAGGTTPKQPCASGTWDHDANPATTCVAWSICDAGKHVSTEGTATADRTCSDCAPGTFTATENQTSCTAWSDCAAGTYVSVPGSAVADRQCAACPDGHFSTMMNAVGCTPWTTCPPGTFESVPGTTTSDRQCAPCPGEVVVQYPDVDGDGFGDDSLPRSDCNLLPGYVTQGGDCNDGDPSIHPDAVEVCGNAVDENCDGIAMTAAGSLVRIGSGIASAVSADGDTVVGRTLANGSYFWTPSSAGSLGFADATLPFSGTPYGVSANGAVIAGGQGSSVGACTYSSQFGITAAARGSVWNGTTPTALPNDVFLSSTAVATSPDGTLVVGFGRTVNPQILPFVWSSGGGMTALAAPGHCCAYGATTSVVVGECDGAGMRWNPQTPSAQPVSLPIAGNGAARAISADGSTIVGIRRLGITSNFVGIRVVGSTVTDLAPLAGNVTAIATAVSADGGTIVGFSRTGGVGSASTATLWSGSLAPVSVERALRAACVDATGWAFAMAYGVSADGKTIVGWGTDPDGTMSAFRARLP